MERPNDRYEQADEAGVEGPERDPVEAQDGENARERDPDQRRDMTATATSERTADTRTTDTPPIADEQMTVPEERDAAAAARRRDVETRQTTTGANGFDLFPGSDLEDFRRRWEVVQASFVDDPRGAAEKADELVGELVGHVSDRHRQLRDELGRHSDQDDTEAMRLALRDYRSFFQRLVGS